MNGSNSSYESNVYESDLEYIENGIPSNTEIFGDVLYIENLDKTCYWDSEFESFYDSDSDCYLYYNNYVDPPVWQYWYEGISSDFGEYGWMEYDESNECWYIETESGWVELPDEYDTDDLWFILESD